jgi:hypothetical protein
MSEPGEVKYSDHLITLIGSSGQAGVVKISDYDPGRHGCNIWLSCDDGTALFTVNVSNIYGLHLRHRIL